MYDFFWDCLSGQVVTPQHMCRNSMQVSINPNKIPQFQKAIFIFIIPATAPPMKASSQQL